MSPRLLGVAGPFQDTAVALSEKEVSIGRDSSNDLWVADRALSRRHCLLVNQSEQFILRDLGSKNGTLVNGVPVTEQVLRDGDPNHNRRFCVCLSAEASRSSSGEESGQIFRNRQDRISGSSSPGRFRLSTIHKYKGFGAILPCGSGFEFVAENRFRHRGYPQSGIVAVAASRLNLRRGSRRARRRGALQPCRGIQCGGWLGPTPRAGACRAR